MAILTANAAIHKLIYPLFIFDLISTIIIFLFFYLARYKGMYKQLILPALITMLVLIDVSWFMSGGYTGPNGFFLIIVLLVGLIISSQQQRLIYTALVVFNVISLHAIEYFNPALAAKIPFHIDIVGQGIILVICLIVVAIIFVKLKRSYDKDRESIVELNHILSEQKSEIEASKKELESYSKKLQHEVELQTNKLALLNTELRDQNTSLEQFTYILSHNIKSPISQLKGLFGLLPDNLTKDKAVAEPLIRMKDSIDQLGEVIHDLSRIIDVRKNSHDIFESVSVTKQLMLALTTLEDQINSADAEIDISKVEDVSIHGMSAYVLSIFYNLINNAIKYSSPDRKPKIVVRANQSEDNVIIRVSDNGIGIDMTHARDRIFQLYQRFNTEIKGKGFGLFLIKT